MNPEFDDLVGTDLDPAERARLERVHELLIAAGPPPEPAGEVIRLRPRRRRGVLVALAAALAVGAFALGVALAEDSGGRNVDFTETMAGTAAASEATASLAVYDLDSAGNWPMELTISGLPRAESGRPYELWLTREGELAALCGGFFTDSTGWATVPMNAPYEFEEFDGWVIVEEGSKTPLLTT